MVTISKNQWDSMKHIKQQDIFISLAQNLREKYSVRLSHMNDEALLNCINIIAANANTYEFEDESHIEQYLDLAIKLGASFHSDPQLPWANKMLADNSYPYSTMTRLYARSYYHVEYMMGQCRVDFPTQAYRALREKWAASFEKPLLRPELKALLSDIWPRKAEKLDDTILGKLEEQQAVLKNLNKTEFMVLAFLLGSGFETDPIFPWSANPDIPKELVWSHLDRILLTETPESSIN